MYLMARVHSFVVASFKTDITEESHQTDTKTVSSKDTSDIQALQKIAEYATMMEVRFMLLVCEDSMPLYAI